MQLRFTSTVFVASWYNYTVLGDYYVANLAFVFHKLFVTGDFRRSGDTYLDEDLLEVRWLSICA